MVIMSSSLLAIVEIFFRQIRHARSTTHNTCPTDYMAQIRSMITTLHILSLASSHPCPRSRGSHDHNNQASIPTRSSSLRKKKKKCWPHVVHKREARAAPQSQRRRLSPSSTSPLLDRSFVRLVQAQGTQRRPLYTLGSQLLSLVAMASSARSGALVAGSGVFKVGSTRCFFGRVQRQQWRCDRPQATGQSPSVSQSIPWCIPYTCISSISV
jgi:hypothetical protein